MSDIEADPAAAELREILCPRCYRGLIDWIAGRSHIPFVPCSPCAPKAAAWLEARQKRVRQ